MFSRGNKCQLMATSLLREVTEPAVFVPEVAKQHDVFVRTIAFGVLVNTHASFWLDEIIRKFFECFNEDLPKLARIPPTVLLLISGRHVGAQAVGLQHSVSILCSLNCVKHFEGKLEHGIPYRPETWKSSLYSSLRQPVIFFIFFLTQWFWIYFLAAWQWKPPIVAWPDSLAWLFGWLVDSLQFFCKSAYQ